LILGNRKE